MDWIDKLSATLTTKAMAATSAVSAGAGVAAERAPLLNEAVFFSAFGYGVNLTGIVMTVSITAGLLAIFKTPLIGLLRLIRDGLRRAAR